MRRAYVFAALFSVLLSVTWITFALIAILLTNRVASAQSVEALVLPLGGLTAGATLLAALAWFYRARVLQRLAYWSDRIFDAPLFLSRLAPGLPGQRAEDHQESDLTRLRRFYPSPAFTALTMLPAMPLLLLAVALLHPLLAGVVLAGISALALLVLFNGLTGGFDLAREASDLRAASLFGTEAARAGPALSAMGASDGVARLRARIRGRALSGGQGAEEFSQVFGGLGLIIVLAAVVSVAGLAAWLNQMGQVTPGVVPGAAILATTILLPILQTVSDVPTLRRARLTVRRLKETLGRKLPPQARPADIANPETIQVASIAKNGATAASPLVLRDIQFTLRPGDGLSVIGPTGSGKTTLAMILCGLLQPDRGTVSFDGRHLADIGLQAAGRHIGYLPQVATLLPGTIAANISRFEPDANHTALVTAALRTGVHETIQRLPSGYNTEIGLEPVPLTGGQIQRIALARALYRTPRLIVLDEPTSSLDPDGEEALAHAVRDVRAEGSAVVMLSQRPCALGATDHILMLDGGTPVEMGETGEVLRKLTRSA